MVATEVVSADLETDKNSPIMKTSWAINYERYILME